MKKFLLSLLFLLFTGLLFAQQPVKAITVKGTVIDSATNKSLGFVTISLSDAATKQPVKSSLTKDEGTFEVKNLAPKPYTLSLVYVGYKTKTLAVKGDADFDVGKIVLSPSNSQLKEVSVSALKPLMKQEVDRLSYDVQADPESKALSALDMMRKVPLLAVDASDNIKLKGSGNYKILINGRESALVAKNPSDVLKAMPATNIQKIEVITTPPAKYDAEGLAGIINIITKKNADQGYNVGINGRINTIWGPGLNINGNVKQGKFGMSAYAGFGRQNHQETGFGNIQLLKDGSAINQNGINGFDGHYQYANAELSYELDSLNLLTGSIETFGNTFNNNGSQVNLSTNKLGGIANSYNLLNSGRGNFVGTDVAINYQLGFKKSKDQLLTFSYKYSNSPNSQSTTNNFINRTSYPASSFPSYNQFNNSGSREHTLQLDYVHPLKKITVEAGAKAILRNNFSEYHREDQDPTTGVFVPNTSQTNDFDYHQDVLSVYNTYQFKLDKWTGKIGARLEHTNINANFTSAGSAVNPDYNNLIPSVSVQHAFKGSSINLGYTQRIQRPGIQQLNPFIDRSNPKFINTGNPNLRPELSNTFEMNYSRFGKNSFNAGLSYAFSNNAIQNVSLLQIETKGSKTDTVTNTTYQNLGTNKTLGLNINMSFPITTKLSFSINGQLSKIWLAGTFNGQYYKNSGFTGNAFGNIAYKFNKGYRFGISSGYFSGDVTLQGQSSKFIFSSYVLSKDFLDKKASISLVANNPYSKYQTFRSSSSSADFAQSSFNQNYYRNFAIRFNYKFGKLNSEIKKNQRGINNDDTKGGAKNTGGGN
ncbi:outer membrane beta-barrel protein [Mucilaginibacter boryungensis]|uniref:TonB-dependent receptor n=1 Tax=Mucilaginibacter boryungensis TaxID=768480 RepID=A0ABR9XCF5_9SPHI|nr:outer membrane beta-barrel protein [Mucilaginibacter boryungensis]MBE9664753.1 TonB-dependent receptor [Mucilaginibacter boryungensis]